MAYDTVLVALADPTRRGIFESLRRSPRTVAELAEGRPVSRPAVSQHLKVLKDAGLVSVQRHGSRNSYSVRREGLEELCRYLDDFWSQVLDAYGAEVGRRVRAGGKRKGKR